MKHKNYRLIHEREKLRLGDMVEIDGDLLPISPDDIGERVNNRNSDTRPQGWYYRQVKKEHIHDETYYYE